MPPISDLDVLERNSLPPLVRELERRNNELKKALDAANKEVESLAYSVAHDLRSPLMHIDGFAHLLQESAGAALDGESREHLGRIVSAAKRMHDLIEALLDYSSVNRAKLVLVEVDMESLLDEALALVKPATIGRSILWQRTRLPTVRADASLLRQVLVNLVSNAVKYTRTRDPAVIEVGTHPGRPDEVILFVRDNGVGFDLKYATRLFSPFQRMHAAEAYQGIGMGLAKVQRIMVRHGGAVWAQAAPDSGATFFFSLPLATGL